MFFDFDGVLCTDRYYTTLLPEYPGVLEWIGAHVFSGEKYCDRWMRGEYTYRQINAVIAEETGISLEQLDELFISSVKQMKVNPVLIKFAKEFLKRHIKTALVTNNMDVFNEITVPEKKLNRIFPVIVNSYDFKLMKHDENGKLFDIALNRLGLSSYSGVLLIDDVKAYCDIFKDKGGEAFHYVNQQGFEQWANKLISS